jgi:hypothetical protein
MSVFAPGDWISGPRIWLSALSEASFATMTWLDEVLAPHWRRPDLQKVVASGAGVLVSDNAGEAIGMAVAALDVPRPGSASVAFIAIEPARRFRGLGGEAALALEGHLRSRLGIEAVYAPVPDGRGLAVYFWLRLGYRPLLPAEAPGAPLGLQGERMRGIWMVRDSA